MAAAGCGAGVVGFMRSSLGALVGAGVALLALAAPAVAAPPDVQQVAPPTFNSTVSVTQVGGRMQLIFPSRISVPSGTLEVSGSRRDTSVNTMDALQTVNGQQLPAGAFQYNFAPDHQHWHYLALDRFDLRTHDASLTDVARDQKTGFCVGDGNPPNTNFCEKNTPSALSVTEIMNPGNVDDYDAGEDGQFIDITGIAAGKYELVQWVNADCRLTDSGPADHTWAVVLDISYPSGTSNPPSVAVTGDTPLWDSYYSGLSAAQQCLPTESVRPQLSGTPQADSTLSAVPGSWMERLVSDFTYQWRRCDPSGWACADIPGATSQNYVPVADDIGHTLRARVAGNFAGDAEQSTPQDSDATAIIAAAPPAPPTPPTPPQQKPSGPLLAPLTSALRARTHMSVATLLRQGLRARAICSQACTARIDLLSRGGVRLGHLSAKLRKAGSRTLHLRLSPKARSVVAHFHAGTLTLLLQVRSRDGQQQTMLHVVHLRP